jgi:carboxyl-terminal processing protease
MHADEFPPTPSSPAPTLPQPPTPKRRRPGVRGPATGLLIATVFVAGIGVGRFAPSVDGGSAGPTASPDAAAGPTGDSIDDFGLIREAWDLLHEKYVGRDTLDDRELAYGAIDGLTEAVGDTGHTDFMTPEERASRNDALSGSYVGIGVQLDTTPAGEPRIVTVFRDSPADKAGLRTDDVILEVDGVPVGGTSTSDVVEKIRGKAGTPVELTVRAGDDGKPRTVTITRGEVEIDAVSSTIVPGTTTGFLRIEQFSNGVADDVRTALEQLRKDGADRLILDLRGNPGGYVGEAVGVASQFLTSGTVYVERNAQGEEKATPVSPDGKWTDLPVIVLVDEGSASSAEIVAGALQDNDRAKVVGATTFGTGTVLGEYALEDGSALRIGTVEWLTPDGRRIWHEGIEPDVAVDRASETLPTLPDDLRGVAAARVKTVADAQVERALQLIAED